NTKGHDRPHPIMQPAPSLLVHVGPCGQLPLGSVASTTVPQVECENSNNKLVATVAVSPPELDIRSFGALVVLCLVESSSILVCQGSAQPRQPRPHAGRISF